MQAYIDDPDRFIKDEKEAEPIYQNMPSTPAAVEAQPDNDKLYQNLNFETGEA